MDSSSSSSSSYLSYRSPSPVPALEVTSMYDILAPLWWDEADWDFDTQSKDDESLTDGEDDLHSLVYGELEETDDDDLRSWGEDISYSRLGI